MDEDKKEHADLEEQGEESTASGAPRISGNASQRSVEKPGPVEAETPAQPGQLPDPNKEMVGSPTSPGRRVESTRDRQKDSEAKV